MTIARFKGTVYPDKSFSLGIVPAKKIKAVDRQYERDLETQPDTDYTALADWLIGTNSIEGKSCSLGDRPLFIKSPKSSRTARGVYGKHGITQFGRRLLKNACILLQDKYGRRRLGFGTATLPGMDKDTCDAINGRISDITRRFYQKIKRKCAKRGSEFIYVGCVEIQEKRFERTSMPVAHLHFVYVAKDSVHSGYLFDTHFAYTAWNESVNEVLVKAGREPIMGNGGHKGSVKLEPIRSSAAAYLGKYISKGIKVVERMKEAGYENFPKQWWTACMQAKKMYRESLVPMDSDVCKAFFYGLEEYLHEGEFLWANYVEVEIDGEYRKIGAVGVLSDYCYNIMVA